MLHPLPSDIVLFARLVKCTAADDRARLARRLLIEADDAHRYCREHSLAHPSFGDGSLVTRLMKLSVPPLEYGDDPEFLTALCIVADAVLTHTAVQSGATAD